MGRRSCSFASSASRASLNWFLRRLLISRPFRRANRGPCALSHGRPSLPTPCNLGHGIFYVRAFSLCLSSPYAPFVGCFHQSCGLAFVMLYERLQGGAVAFGLATMNS